MPLPATLLILATLLPLASFAVLVFVGRRMGTPLAGWFATAAIGGSFLCSVLAMGYWYRGGQMAAPATGAAAAAAEPLKWGYRVNPIDLPMKWVPIGTSAVPNSPGANGLGQSNPGWLDVGVYVDSLTITMFAMITLVATLVHVFSIGYMREDKRFPRFFTYLGLFCFSMLGLVLGGTVLQLFIFWELVGLCSYLLIGFWYEKKSASNAAIKAFVVNRVGDFGFLIGFGILFYHLGNVSLPRMWLALGSAGAGGPITLADGTVFTGALLTVMGVGLFFGAVGKSAQFPLHVWLPDAMEGPTPVSALIHAATMVAAGVYLVGRIFPVLTPDAKLFVAIIGCVTLTMAALIAIAQSDIKKVLAYSTLSQLGYMILAMGIGSWVGGLFHLITHAFFKALLFLGSGSVIHAAHHEQELPQYGGLIRKIPVTGITFAIAVLAISGTPLFSGHYSKDMILAHAGAFASLAADEGRSKWYWAFFILPTVIAYVTAFYMMRCWMLTFWGKPRNQHLYDHAHEAPIMWVPLAVLAIFSVIGWISVPELLEGSVRESSSYVQWLADRDTTGAYKGKTVAGFATAWPIKLGEGAAEAGPASAVTPFTPSQEAHERGENLTKRFVTWAFVIGIGAGFFIYLRGYAVAHVLVRIPPLGWIHKWLYDRMYFDELYFFCFVSVTMALAAISGWFDRYVVDGIVNGVARLVKQSAFGVGANDRYVVDGAVNGLGHLAHGVGSAVRNPQSGRVRLYVTMLMLAVALGVAGAVIAVLSR
jgi:NADH-quinone oxidoreductase subunit L